MKQFIDSYFDFSASERKGIILLFLVILIAIAAPTVYRLFKVDKPTDFKAFEKAILLFQDQTQATRSPQAKDIYNPPFAFNPNTLSPDSLTLLGLNKRVVKNITNYRNKGGRFFKKEDFKKIYSLEDSTYNRLESYILIPQKQKIKPVYVTQKSKHTPSSAPEQEVTLIPFDPNTADKELLLNLGLSPKVVNIIYNFRDKGGKFYKKEDLKKIYGLAPAKYDELAPYIIIEKQSPKYEKKRDKTKKQTAQAIIDINKTNSDELLKMKGIGPYYSQSIVSYRDQLGGYHNIEQLSEIYNFPDSVIQIIKPFLSISNSIQKMNINQASQEDLAKHPYLNYKQAKTIINYRNQHGPYQSIDDLKKVRVLNEELISKIKPYCSFQ